MNGPARWTPRLIIAIAVIHTVFAFVVKSDVWADIARAGVVAGIDGVPEREAALWFVYAGIGFLALGTLAARSVRATGRVPRQVAVYLVVIGGTMIVVDPASGGWLVLAAGLLAAWSRRAPHRPAGAQAAPDRTEPVTP
ncbi:hypothetical protein GCM10009678_66790 [Actinomadura kijaniata]|uniref:Uncharacterized protein n=1 Tax=Actinomadura namibiensis TaxID=182080 RepID=A0A7W3LQP6_ACTNM|nr:DUF6463 family protein [Actinomadura namibiensis]MBA8952489.1 hypothetical protein [Actinomadura namibiensis]